MPSKPSNKKPSKAAAPAPAPKEEHATVPVRVSPTVHKFIIEKAAWGESIDKTLRRLLNVPETASAAVVAGR